MNGFKKASARLVKIVSALLGSSALFVGGVFAETVMAPAMPRPTGDSVMVGNIVRVTTASQATDVFYGYMFKLVRGSEAYCASIGVDVSHMVKTFERSHTELIKAARAVLKEDGFTEEQYWDQTKPTVLAATKEFIQRAAKIQGIAATDVCRGIDKRANVVETTEYFRKGSEDSYRLLMEYGKNNSGK